MNDSFLLFWDVRKPNLLGGYWDTFGDDVTEVKFHPESPDTLVSESPPLLNCRSGYSQNISRFFYK